MNPTKPPTHPQHGEQLDPTDGDGGGRVLGSDPERRADSSPGHPRTEGRGASKRKICGGKKSNMRLASDTVTYLVATF